MNQPLLLTPSPEPLSTAIAPPSPAAISLHGESSFHWILLALCTAVLAASCLLSIRESSLVIVPGLNQPLPALCTSKRLFNIDCPGCGMTRSFIALAHGDLAAAWSYNPAGLLLFVILAFQIPYRSLQLWRIHRGLPELSLPRLAHWSLAFLGIAVILQWLIRLSW